MKSLPFGEAPNLAEELILGTADCTREGVMLQSMVVDGKKEISRDLPRDEAGSPRPGHHRV